MAFVKRFQVMHAINFPPHWRVEMYDIVNNGKGNHYLSSKATAVCLDTARTRMMSRFSGTIRRNEDFNRGRMFSERNDLLLKHL